jgi:hypothetical protein
LKVDADHRPEIDVETVVGNHRLEHARSAIRQDGAWQIAQAGEHRRHLAERVQREVGVHEALARGGIRLKTEPTARERESRFRNGPEVLVPSHEASEPRVLELFLAPERRQLLRVAGDGPPGFHDRVDVEQRPVRVEEQPGHLHVQLLLRRSGCAAPLPSLRPSPYNDHPWRGFA